MPLTIRKLGSLYKYIRAANRRYSEIADQSVSLCSKFLQSLLQCNAEKIAAFNEVLLITASVFRSRDVDIAELLYYATEKKRSRFRTAGDRNSVNNNKGSNNNVITVAH